MIVNAVLYEYGIAPDFVYMSIAPKMSKASFKSIFEKIFKT